MPFRLDGIDERFCVASSDGTGFLVISDKDFIAGLMPPSAEELFCLTQAAIKRWLEAPHTVILVDFEGEMPGHGGELTTAVLLPTEALDPETLAPRNWVAEPAMRPWGLFLDLRTMVCVEILKRILENPGIVKVMWGANADVESLMYQQVPCPLHCYPIKLLDIQLAFCDSFRRIGMKRMLERVPAEYLRAFPDKDQIDFDLFHSRNQRCMPYPLQRTAAFYAMDDVLRIEAILRSQLPPGGNFRGAFAQTERAVDSTAQDSWGILTLENKLHWLQRSMGQKRVVNAVEIARHTTSLRLRGAQLSEHVLLIERAAAIELQRANLHIHDLSFAEVPLPR